MPELQNDGEDESGRGFLYLPFAIAMLWILVAVGLVVSLIFWDLRTGFGLPDLDDVLFFSLLALEFAWGPAVVILLTVEVGKRWCL